MPISIKKGDNKPQPAEAKKSAGNAAGVAREVSPKLMIAAGVFLVVVILALYHVFVNPVVTIGGEPKVTKVKPLPGFPDTPPYNTKEWQDAFKQGKASFISGVPPQAGPPSGGAPPTR